MANDHVKQKNEINTCQNHSKPSILWPVRLGLPCLFPTFATALSSHLTYWGQFVPASDGLWCRFEEGKRCIGLMKYVISKIRQPSMLVRAHIQFLMHEDSGITSHVTQLRYDRGSVERNTPNGGPTIPFPIICYTQCVLIIYIYTQYTYIYIYMCVCLYSMYLPCSWPMVSHTCYMQ